MKKAFLMSVVLIQFIFSSMISFANADTKKIADQLGKVMPNASIDNLNETPIKGVYEITSGSNVLYSNEDGSYMLYGQLLDLTNATAVSLTENTQKGIRLKSFASLDKSSTIYYGPRKPKHTITVFTDIDCAYCRKFHLEVPELNKAGIGVQYVAFPRSGVDTPSFETAAKVWCAENPQEALTKAKAGQEFATNDKCDKRAIIRQHLKLVSKLQLSGTPALFLEDGTLIPGYVPAKQLVARLEAANKA